MPFPYQGKQIIAIDATAATNAATATGSIDTLDFDFLTVDVLQTTSDDTTNNPSVYKFTEGDTTVISNASAITALTGDDSDGWTIPAAVTSGSHGTKFNIDLRGRKRYLFLSISPVTTQTFTAIANLFKGTESPRTTTIANVKALVEA